MEGDGIRDEKRDRDNIEREREKEEGSGKMRGERKIKANVLRQPRV